MDVVQSCLSAVPVPGLHLLFGIFRSLWVSILQLKASRSRVKALATCMAQLLTEVNRKFSSNQLSQRNYATALESLTQLLEEISAFVEKQLTYSFIKTFVLADQRALLIEGYHRRIVASVSAFQIGALVDIQEWQQRSDASREEDQQALRAELRELQLNRKRLVQVLEVRADSVVTIMCALQKKLNNDTRETQENVFITNTLRVLATWGGNQVQVKHWTITSLEIELGPILGSGGFGTVRRGVWNQLTVAVKLFRTDGLALPDPQDINREVEMLSKLRHPNIVQFIGANVLDGDPFLVMPYYKNGNARSYVKEHPECFRLKIVYDACLGLVYLHSLDIVHGDIKAMNILIDDAGNAVLCDLGLSRIKADVTTRTAIVGTHSIVIGSRNWMSPERLLGRKLRLPVDIYAMGMTIYEIFTSETPLGEAAPSELRELVVQHKIRPEKPIEDEAPQMTDAIWEITERCWAHEASQRPIASVLCESVHQIVEETLAKARRPNLTPVNDQPDPAIRRVASRASVERETPSHVIELKPPNTVQYPTGVVSPPPNEGITLPTPMPFPGNVQNPPLQTRIPTPQPNDGTSASRSQNSMTSQQLNAQSEVASQRGPRPHPPPRSSHPESHFTPPEPRRSTPPEPIDHTNEPEKEFERAIADLTLVAPAASSLVPSPPPPGPPTGSKDHTFHFASSLMAESSVLATACLHEKKYREAELICEQIHASRLATFGSSNSLTILAARDLAWCYHGLGRMEEAKKLLETVIYARQEEDLSSMWMVPMLEAEVNSLADRSVDNLDTLEAASYLALLYHSRKDNNEALVLAKRSVAGFEAQRGAEHVSTLSKVVALAQIYRSQKHHRDADTLFLRAISGYEKILGADHFVTLDVVMELAKSHSDHDRYHEADALFQRCLAGYESTLAPNHAATLFAVQGLAISYYNQQRDTEAEPLFKRCIPALEARLGFLHELTIDTSRMLAHSYKRMAYYDKAVAVYQKTLMQYDQATRSSRDNPSILALLQSMGDLLAQQDKHAEALVLHRRLLGEVEMRLGCGHPYTLTVACDLVVDFRELGLYSEAVELLERLMAGNESLNGSTHTSTLSVAFKLGVLYFIDGRLAEAASLFERSMSGRQARLGPDNSATLDSMFWLAKTRRAQGQFDTAEDLYRRVLEVREMLNGKDDEEVRKVTEELDALQRERTQNKLYYRFL